MMWMMCFLMADAFEGGATEKKLFQQPHGGKAPEPMAGSQILTSFKRWSMWEDREDADPTPAPPLDGRP